jgi:predicted nicotinamide N-methyase
MKTLFLDDVRAFDRGSADVLADLGSFEVKGGQVVGIKGAKPADDYPQWALCRLLDAGAGADGVYIINAKDKASEVIRMVADMGVKANPWARESFNLTHQVLIGKERPELAAELRKLAGVQS